MPAMAPSDATAPAPEPPPAAAPDVMPPHPLPPEGSEPVPEGSNTTIHRPDPAAGAHPADPGAKPRSPYVTGNS